LHSDLRLIGFGVVLSALLWGFGFFHGRGILVCLLGMGKWERKVLLWKEGFFT